MYASHMFLCFSPCYIPISIYSSMVAIRECIREYFPEIGGFASSKEVAEELRKSAS